MGPPSWSVVLIYRLPLSLFSAFPIVSTISSVIVIIILLSRPLPASFPSIIHFLLTTVFVVIGCNHHQCLDSFRPSSECQLHLPFLLSCFALSLYPFIIIVHILRLFLCRPPRSSISIIASSSFMVLLFDLQTSSPFKTHFCLLFRHHALWTSFVFIIISPLAFFDACVFESSPSLVESFVTKLSTVFDLSSPSPLLLIISYVIMPSRSLLRRIYALWMSKSFSVFDI